MRFSAWMMAATLLAPGLALHAQENRDRPAYKVEFTIRDTGDAGGKTGRKYSLLVNPGVNSEFRVGNRVPVATGGGGGGTMVNTQFSYVDVGINIDCMVNDFGSKLSIHANLDVSTAVMPDKSAAVQNPTISQIRVNIDTAVAPGKPTVVASFDDPVTARKFDIDVAIAKI